MKKILTYTTVGILLLVTIVLTTNCKKEEDPIVKEAPIVKDPIVPAFIVTANTVQLQGGGEGLQFFAKCTNDDVKMTKVLLTDPVQSPVITYNLNDSTFVKSQIFGLQKIQEAYSKQTGTWSFIFVGNRTADKVSFSSTFSLTVGK